MMRSATYRTFAGALAATFLAASGPAFAQPVLIKDGKVVTNVGAPIEGGDVLIDGGRIVAVGRTLAPPAGARIIEAQGKWVTPGVIAAISEVGLSEISGSGAPNDAEIDSDKISAAADAARAFDPAASAIAITRIEGVTRAVIAPAAHGSIFSGIGAVVSLSGEPNSLQQRHSFEVIELGEAGARLTGGSRAALWPILESALKDAREYPARYVSGQGGAVLDEVDAAALKPFALGQGLFLVKIEKASDIRELLKFKRANPTLRFAIHGGAEAWLVADELARAQVPVIVDPLVNLPDKMEKIGARLDNAALLEKAGVRVVIAPSPGTVDAQQARLALQLAGNAVANGMSWDAAFAAITLRPAQVFGLGATLGSLQAGMTADVVVWDGDPLEVQSAPTAVFIAGKQVPLVSRQTQLRDRYSPVRR